jgi:gluconolactonase
LKRCVISFAFLVSILFGVYAGRAVTFQIADSNEFSKIIDINAVLTTNVYTNTWLEGPVWIPTNGGGYLVFCDQDYNRLSKLDPPTNVTDFVLPPANTLYNGTMLDAQERLIACQAGGAGLRVVMITNGIVTPLVTNCYGLKFYSPNDVVVKSDGTMWFTDPGYNGGIGTPPQPGFQTNYYVFQFNPTNGDASCRPVITSGLLRPNGLCFSPDESKLYVADSASSRHRIHVYSVSASNTLSGGAVFATITNGVPDGIRCDVDGRVWSSGGEGVYIFSTNGLLIGQIRFNLTANLCWGGPQYKTLYMTGEPLVASIPVLVAGMPSVKTLRQNLEGSQLKLTWPAPSTDFELQEIEQLGSSANWTNSDAAIIVTNSQNSATIETTNDARFFRLRLNN